MKKVSIIIPCYNCSKYIEKCIDSLTNQTYKNIEIVIIDDGSIDNLKTICNKILKKYNNVKYFFKENGGLSSARNYGIKMSSGDYVLFIDADDYIDNNAVELLVENTSENELACIQVIAEYENNPYKVNDDLSIIMIDSYEYLNGLLSNKFPGYSCGYLFEKEKLVNNEILYNENIKYIEDFPFIVQIVELFKKINVITGGAVYHYVQVPNSLVHKKNKFVSNINNIFMGYKSVNNYISKFDDYDLKHRLLLNKISKLIEVEVAKNYTNFEFNKCVDEVKSIIFEIRKDNINLFYKIYFYFILCNKFILYLYIQLRKILKRMKKND